MAKVAIEGASRANLFYVDPDDITLSVIDYDSGPDDPLYNPRNKMPLGESFVQSIMCVGIRSPIEVIKKPDGSLVPVFGNQRVRAAREANKRYKEAGNKARVLVPCKSPTKGADDAEIAEVRISENEQRQESPALIKAEEATLLLRHIGGDEQKAAKIYGVSITHFRSLLSLRESTGELKAALKSGKLSASAAAVIASLPAEQQAARVEQIVAAGGSVEVAKTAVREAKGKTDSARPSLPLLRQLLALRARGDMDAVAVGDPFWNAVEWLTGERKASQIKGLSAAIAALQDKNESEAA